MQGLVQRTRDMFCIGEPWVLRVHPESEASPSTTDKNQKENSGRQDSASAKGVCEGDVGDLNLGRLPEGGGAYCLV